MAAPSSWYDSALCLEQREYYLAGLFTVGYGPLYQGRFKSFQVQCDDHLLFFLRDVERDPLSAGLVERAELWRWSSLWSTAHGDKAVKALLSPWPVERPANWTVRVSSPLTAKELDRVRVSLARGRPYGADDWVMQTVSQLGLQHTVRPEGRAPHSEPICGRHDELAPGKCWQCETQKNRKPSGY